MVMAKDDLRALRGAETIDAKGGPVQAPANARGEHSPNADALAGLVASAGEKATA